MAVLSFSIISTLICASILTKLSARYSIGKSWLSSGLFRYLHPPNSVLKTAAGRATLKGAAHRRKNKDDDNEVKEGFAVPKDAYIDLETAVVKSLDVLQLPFYVEFRWLVDYVLCACVVYCSCEVYSWVMPLQSSSEINVSLVWCLVGIFLALKCLVSLNSLYFRESSDSGERSLVLCIGCVYFLFAMVFMLLCDRVLDLDLRGAYNNFTSISNAYLVQQEIDIVGGDRSPILLYLTLSLLVGLLAGMLVFPSFRYARMYLGALEYASERPFIRVVLHTSFSLPLMIVLLWIRRLSNETSLDADQIDSLRVWSIVLLCVLRIATMRLCLQAYLNTAREKLTSLNRETGRINSLLLQRTVARTFMYLCTVALQYIIPLVLMLMITFLLKTKGGYTWMTSYGLPPSPIGLLSVGGGSTGVESLANVFYLFNCTVCRGMLSLLLVSLCLVTTSLSFIGVVYEKQFAN